MHERKVQILMDSHVELVRRIKEELCPGGIWKLGSRVENVLKSWLSKLPRKHVSEEERKHPTSPAGIRSQMNAFFARHFFQVQDSLLNKSFSQLIKVAVMRGRVSIVDIGSGPAIASLALLDLLDHAAESGILAVRGKLRITAVLNDVSDACLNVGQKLLEDYFCQNSRCSVQKIIPVSVPFPRSIVQLSRVSRLFGPYDVCCMSYVLDLLEEQSGLKQVCDGIRQLSGLFSRADNQVTILTDRFHESLHKRASRELGGQAEVTNIKQKVYDTDNSNLEHTYTFFRTYFPGLDETELASTAVSGTEEASQTKRIWSEYAERQKANVSL